jgi:hypothetical protein
MFWKVAILYPISYCKSALKANLFFSHEYEFSLSFCLQAFIVRMSSCWAIVARRFHGTAGGTHRQAGPQEVKTKAWVSSSQSNSVSPAPFGYTATTPPSVQAWLQPGVFGRVTCPAASQPATLQGEKLPLVFFSVRGDSCSSRLVTGSMHAGPYRMPDTCEGPLLSSCSPWPVPCSHPSGA